MPAAAVISAPIAYIKVVAVKKLVVEGGGGREGWSEKSEHQNKPCMILMGGGTGFVCN